ncbi:origin recognition complex subunit 3 N-terminus-domain-containing protein [Mucor mucedo]|uniref:origin recognition complex subunit 3 N-terminus-domain-containing protein n=1 Tax=Mucor mucedo TaxID=29922 RepID=UPI0022211083|nr:origin recognition complex subunit 3 N-terminus-domain-containing protein [Mucor mucedo]KAI7896366.1 origin recognition complex subunit 3 N-terminus-domain-containing protein [Mucor mucedo]
MIERFLENTPNALSTDLDHDIIMDDNEENDDDAEDEEDIIRTTELLEGWYRHHQQSYENKPNLVIILQDFESFEPAILQDFFTICSEYRSRLPIVCIMGIATSTEILHQSLNKSTIGLLRIEKFRLEQSGVWFNRVIEKVLLDSTSTLKFGARPYKFLLDHFYLYDFSMTKVTASLKYALMHHFYGNPLSIFLPLLQMDEFDMTATLQQWIRNDFINEHHITHIRMLGSFKNYVESLADTDPKKALQLLEDDDFLITEVVPSLLCDIKIYQEQFKMGFNLLLLLQKQFPSFSSVNKSKLMLLLEVLEAKDGLSENTDMVRRLVSFVRKIDTEHVGRLLKELRHLFSEYENVNESFLEQLAVWDKRYEGLMEADDNYNTRMDRKSKLLEGMVLENEQRRHTETARKVQDQALEHLKRKGTEASKIAMDIADWCDKTLGHLLRSFTKMPLFELVYYTNIKLHEKSFASQPRASAQTALTQPQHYINCSCCDIEKSDQIVTSEHDTCILYKLYLECGRLINLYDWFVAFGCIIEREKRPANQKLEENEVQARFIRSVAELQFLGFIKPTQRKTDHVIRLTWSNI